jgi:peptidyl-prolyl cis-trans isomerase B (cyclophilin B)
MQSKRFFFATVFSFFVLVLAGCSAESEATNPLDPEVLRKAGSSVNQDNNLENKRDQRKELSIAGGDLPAPDSAKEPDSAQKPTTTEQKTLNNKNSPTNMDNQKPVPQNSDYASKYKSAVIKTNLGEIKVSFFGADSPKTVNNFLKLANEGFYNKTTFHRVIKDFMIQGGDPLSKDDDWSNDGTGGPGYSFADEFNDHKLVRGSLAMANSGPNTNGSQFFIVTAEQTPHLDGKHTNFGEVTEGMAVLDKIENQKTNNNDHPLVNVVIEGIELLEK